MRPANTVAEWLTWAEQIPQHGSNDTASDGPAETTMTGADPDGLRAENAWARQQNWFAA